MTSLADPEFIEPLARPVDLAWSNEGRLFEPIRFAQTREVRIAVVAFAISAVIFLAVAPFAKTQLGDFAAFVPMYVSALVICDLITAALLLSQYRFLRSRALLVLAAGYLFTGFMTAFYVVIFPGIFAPPGFLGSGPQSTSAMYMLWHSGLPLIVIVYALLRRGPGRTETMMVTSGASPRIAITATIGAVFLVALACLLFATLGQGLIPTFLENNHTTTLGRTVLTGVWLLSALALVILWRRKPHTLLDFWVMLVMGVWLCDIALAALLNAGRYDLGWYVGRAYGLTAASALLVVLLVENGNIYARLAKVTAKLNEATKSFEQLSLHDPLTGLANRRYFDTYLASQIAIAKRHQRPLALVICDIDLFKSFNDHFGHPAGDECLRQIAAALGSCCRRPADLAARYGGEEFALILPETDLAGAELIAEMARAAIAELQITHAVSEVAPYVSISAGVSCHTVNVHVTAEQLIEEADKNLFGAKRLGRNRVFGGQAPEPAAPRIAVSGHDPDEFALAS